MQAFSILSLQILPIHEQCLLPPLAEPGEVILLREVSSAPQSIQIYHLNSFKTASIQLFLAVYHKYSSVIQLSSLDTAYMGIQIDLH